MDDKTEKIIQKVTEEFQNEGLEITKIYWNGDTGKVIVITIPKNKMDGIYLYENTLSMKRLFSPTEDFEIFNTVVTDENLIYDDTNE